jgi:hypothetical protein
VFRDESNGFVRLGYLDPALIETVVTDPQNREQPIGIVTRKDSKGQARRYRVIVNVQETAFAQRTAEIRATFTDGDCFYFRINDLSSATRGRSDLLAQMDWLDIYDQFMFGEIERAAAMRAYVWDVTLTGASPEDVLAKAKTDHCAATRCGARAQRAGGLESRIADDASVRRRTRGEVDPQSHARRRDDPGALVRRRRDREPRQRRQHDAADREDARHAAQLRRLPAQADRDLRAVVEMECARSRAERKRTTDTRHVDHRMAGTDG